MTSRQPTRVRLRDKLSSLDCLDLSTHSSALLSPFLSSQSAFASGDDSENTFPFRISPTNSTTTASRQHASKQSPKQRSPRLDHRPLASVANLTSAPFDRLVQASSAVQPAAVAKSAFHVTTDTAAANIHLTTAASQPGQHAKRAADPRRESTVLFKGFSASSAESGLLEISEIADINGSPEIVRHQQSVPVPLEPHLGSASSPLRQSGQDTIHRTRASSANATSEALRISLSSSSHASLSEDSRDGGLAPINTTPSQLTPTASQAGAAQQLQQQEAHLLQEQHSHLQQQNQQSPQQQDQQHMQSPPLQHAIQQELATPVAAEGSLLHQAANAPASPSDSDTVPALDLECSSLRLQALAAANAPADEEGSGAGLGMPADQSGQRPAHTEVLLPVEASSPAISGQPLARKSGATHVRESASMRRSVGMRESMCFFLQLEGAVEGQNGFEPEEVLQLDEVRRQSGGRQHLPAVPEEDEVYAEHTDHVPAAPADNSATAAVTTLATNPPEASTPPLQDPHQRPAAVALPAMQQPASHLQHAVTPPAASKQGYAAAHQKQADQNQSHQLAVRTVRSNQALQQRQHGAVQLAVSQTNLQQRHKSLHPSGSQPDARHARKGAASNASSPGGSSPSAASALDTKRSSPGSSHAVEHSSVSLSQLALASRSKLRAPSSLSSPPKRGSRAAIHKQATHNHLASLAANVPLPASPVNDAKEPPAVVALATAVAKPSHIPAPVGKPSRLKKPTNTSGFFSSGRSFTNAQRPNLAQAAVRSAAPSTAAAAGQPTLARVSAPTARSAPEGQSGPGPRAGGAAVRPDLRHGHGMAQPSAAGSPNLARPSAPVQSATAQENTAASPRHAGTALGHADTASGPPNLARPSAPAPARAGCQLPPSGASAKTKSKGVMASVLGSVKKAVGFKSRTKDLQEDDAGSPKPERSAMSSMGFTRPHPSHSRLPSMSGPSASAGTGSHGTQRSGLSFSRKGRTFTRESTPPLSSDVEALLSNEELAFQGRGGGVGNSPADRAAKEASLRRSAQERHWQDYSASLQ